MKKIIFLLLITILSINLFAHTKMYYGGAGIFYPLTQTEEEIQTDDYSYSYDYESEEPKQNGILDNAIGFDIRAGQTTFFDHDDTDDKFVPIFDFSFAFSFYWPGDGFGGVGIDTRYLGGFSFRPVSLILINLAAGAKVSGVYGGGNWLIPDALVIDGIIDASLNLNAFYIAGLKFGMALNLGMTGFYINPYVSITTALENLGLRM